MSLRRSALTWSVVLSLGGVVAAACGSEDGESGDGDGDEGGASGDGDGDAGGESGDGDGDQSETPPTFCSSDKECREGGGVCDTELHTCVECQNDVDCGDGELCRRSSCVEIVTCNSSKDCPVDEICSDTLGYCVNCEGANDCAEGEACVYYSCLPACNSDKDCTADDGVCNTDDGVCLECFRTADCADGQYCNVVGECVARICEDGESFCDGSGLVACNEDGSGFALSECPDGCEEGACIEEGECVTGDADCACYPNDTCNDDLVCEEGLCIDPNGGTGGSDSGTGGGANGTGGGGNGTGGSGGGTCGDLILVSSPGPLSCTAGVVDNFDDNDSDSCFGGSYLWEMLNGTMSISSGALNIAGDVEVDEYGGAGLRPYSTGPSVDLSAYTGIEFSVGGTGAATLMFAMHSANSYEGKGHVSHAFNVNSVALTYRVPFCHLSALSTHPSAPEGVDVTEVTEIQFLATGGDYDFVIDNVRYY